MKIEPTRWEIIGTFISIEKIETGYVVYNWYKEEALKYYDDSGVYYWRTDNYESKYDLAEFSSLEAALEGIKNAVG